MISDRKPPDLRRQTLFASLPAQAQSYLQARLERRDYSSGVVIVQIGERMDRLVIIGRGRVTLQAAAGDKRTLRAGQSFGNGMLRFGVPSSFIARAETRCTVWTVRRQDWLYARELPPQTLLAPAKPPSGIRIRTVILAALTVMALAILFLGPGMVSMIATRMAGQALQAYRPEQAAEYLTFALRLRPGSAEMNDAMGFTLFQQGDLEQARLFFEKAVELDEDLASARNNLGVVYLRLGKPRAAIPHLEAAVELDPANSQAYHNLGNARLQAGNLQKAAAAYQRAFELDPNQLEAQALWAGIAMDLGELTRARRAWEEVIQADPRQSLALRGLGAIAVLEGRPEDALPDLLAAREADPEDVVTRVYLGLALEALKRPADAAAEFEQALALSRDPSVTELAQTHLLELFKQLTPGSAYQKGGVPAGSR